MGVGHQLIEFRLGEVYCRYGGCEENIGGQDFGQSGISYIVGQYCSIIKPL